VVFSQKLIGIFNGQDVSDILDHADQSGISPVAFANAAFLSIGDIVAYFAILDL
jgi:hypothetical protein